MKKQTAAWGLCGALLALGGCSPELAQVNYGTEEAQWAQSIQNSYPGYRTPRTAPPAIVDNMSPRLIEAEEEKAQAQQVEDDSAVSETVDFAAETGPETTVPADTAKDVPGTAEAAKDAPATPDTAKDAPAATTEKDGLEFTVYTVKAGDTLSSIAKEQYGDAKKYDVIIKANGITDPAKVRIGTKLQIPKL